jgi:primosomal replication protein N
MYYNRIILVGRLTRDPELRATPDGTSVVRFTLAVDRGMRAGEERQTDFFDIVAFRQLADNVANYVTKGRLVLVEGNCRRAATPTVRATVARRMRWLPTRCGFWSAFARASLRQTRICPLQPPRPRRPQRPALSSDLPPPRPRLHPPRWTSLQATSTTSNSMTKT